MLLMIRSIFKSIDVNQEGLKYLSEELSKLKLQQYHPLEILFLLMDSNERAIRALLRGIIVRQIDLYDMPDFIRVT